MAHLITPYATFMLGEKGKLKRFINEFNKTPEPNAALRIFYLQKINFILNQISLDKILFDWANTDPTREGTWEHTLISYGITPHASFFVKGAQYAQAVAERTPASPIPQNGEDIHLLMQQRDTLLAKDSVSPEDQDQYISLCCRINHQMQTQQHYKELIAKHEHVLKDAEHKIRAIQGHTREMSPAYKTITLNKGNNYNYQFKIEGNEEVFILRFEDRYNLDLEQSLHAYPVAMHYFADDIAVFMMQHKTEDEDFVAYKPTAFSQFANQASLYEVAEKLNGAPLENVIAATTSYFSQLTDFCIKLQQANHTYHPDIKLSNFLVHNNKLLVSDRKTLVRGRTQCAAHLRASKDYAPPEYTFCINWSEKAYHAAANQTYLDMEQFMAYGVGIALKEFLGLTRVKELPSAFFNSKFDVKQLFAAHSNHQIDNFALVIQAMTNRIEGNRLSIAEFQQLIPHVAEETASFKKRLERIINTETFNKLNQIVQNKQLTGTKLLQETATALKSLINQKPLNARIQSLAEQLSQHYLTQQTKAITNAMAERDWALAPWYRKLAYYLSFSLYGVAQVSQPQDVTIALDFKNQSLENHRCALHFLPKGQTDELQLLEAYVKSCSAKQAEAHQEEPNERVPSGIDASEDEEEIESAATMIIEANPSAKGQPSPKASIQPSEADSSSPRHRFFPIPQDMQMGPKYNSLHRVDSAAHLGDELRGMFAVPEGGESEPASPK